MINCTNDGAVTPSIYHSNTYSKNINLLFCLITFTYRFHLIKCTTSMAIPKKTKIKATIILVTVPVTKPKMIMPIIE